jgi:hypothetical protein
MMDKIDTDNIKHSHNIVDIIEKYVPLKKQGKNWFGCCPFHSEKSPSFSVDEKDQFYHCFGCGENGDVIKFVQEFSGMNFVDACKELGAEVDLMPSKKVQENKKLSASINRHLPGYDRRNKEKSADMVNGLTPCKNGSYQVYGEFWYQVLDFDGEMVNLYDPLKNEFLAGGVSHLAFTPIRKNQTENWLVVVDFWQGIKIANDRAVNVLITFSAYNTLLVCNHVDDMNKAPVIRYEDVQAELLCGKGVWIHSDECGNLTKKKKGEYVD